MGTTPYPDVVASWAKAIAAITKRDRITNILKVLCGLGCNAKERHHENYINPWKFPNYGESGQCRLNLEHMPEKKSKTMQCRIFQVVE